VKPVATLALVRASSVGALTLCAIIFAPHFLPNEISVPLIVTIGLLIWIKDYRLVEFAYFKLVWPLFGIFVIGIVAVLVSLLFVESPQVWRDIMRDIGFSLTPISLIVIGYWLADDRGMWPLILKVLVTCGFAFAAMHIAAFVADPTLLTADVLDVRSIEGGAGNLVVLLALIFLLFQDRFEVGSLCPKYLPRTIVLPMLLASLVLSYSRTVSTVGVIMVLSLWGVGTRANLRTLFAAIGLVVGVTVFLSLAPADETGTFLSKLAHSFTEIEAYDYADYAEMSAHWRGYETNALLAEFASGNVLQQVFGRGFGAVVDLGFYMELSGVEFRYLPIFHNGYGYILLKTGALGLGLYLYFYFNVIRYAMRHSIAAEREIKYSARLLFGCVWSLVLMMLVVGGMAQIAAPAFVLLLGYLERRISQLQSTTVYVRNR
jgi:hypothetical protein